MLPRWRSTTSLECAKKCFTSTSVPPAVDKPYQYGQQDPDTESTQQPEHGFANADAIDRPDQQAQKEKDAAGGGRTSFHALGMPFAVKRRKAEDSWLTLC